MGEACFRTEAKESVLRINLIHVATLRITDHLRKVCLHLTAVATTLTLFDKANMKLRFRYSSVRSIPLATEELIFGSVKRNCVATAHVIYH
jgi:hypothetical protein